MRYHNQWKFSVRSKFRKPGPALRNANLARLDIDFIEANRYQHVDPDAHVVEGFDQHHISKVSAVPDSLVEAANVLLCVDLREPHLFARDRDLQPLT
jgi:hypothetical protein